MNGFIFQRACYLSLNPQKDETLETEKAQYTLPDGSTLDVRKKNIYQPIFNRSGLQMQFCCFGFN